MLRKYLQRQQLSSATCNWCSKKKEGKVSLLLSPFSGLFFYVFCSWPRLTGYANHILYLMLTFQAFSLYNTPASSSPFFLHYREQCLSFRLSQNLTLCNSMDCNIPGFPVLHYLREFAQTHRPSSRWCHPTTLPSVIPSPPTFSLPASGSFPMSQLFQ